MLPVDTAMYRIPYVPWSHITLIGWKTNYPEIGYPEFCQLIEQENRDPNKHWDKVKQITVYLEITF